VPVPAGGDLGRRQAGIHRVPDQSATARSHHDRSHLQGPLAGWSCSSRRFKQNLKIKTFVGTSANAVKTQVWTALIAPADAEVPTTEVQVRLVVCPI